MGAHACTGTPLLGMGIQPGAYQSPSLSRFRPAPLPLPSPRPSLPGALTDGPFSRRRGLVDAAPSPMPSDILRTANAGRTPGVGRSQGLKRPAGEQLLCNTGCPFQGPGQNPCSIVRFHCIT